MEVNIAELIGQYGFPIIAAFGLGYFIYYIWKWVTEQVDPVIGESHMTLIALIDRIRMLDNDLIRLRTKLDMILENQEKKEKEQTDDSPQRINRQEDPGATTTDRYIK
jgi:hypothetical protein